MTAFKQGGVILTILCLFMILTGCEDMYKQPETGKMSGISINKALQQENELLKKERDEIDKKYKHLKIKMQEMNKKNQAWIIFQNEVDVIISELAKIEGVIRGRSRISLGEKILFKTGSADLSESGKSILSQYAQELRRQDHIIHIEGHTDSVPVGVPRNRKLYKDNWGLSAARAAEVVRYLAGPGRIPPKRLVGVFYGQFRPLAKNDKKGNPKNRRVEIRLVPPYIEAEKTISISSAGESGDTSSGLFPKSYKDTYLDSSEAKEEPVTVEKTDTKEDEPEGIIPVKDDKEEPIEKIDDQEETPVIIR